MAVTASRQIMRALGALSRFTLLALVIALVWALPAIAQPFVNSEWPEENYAIESNIPMFRRGNLYIAPVFLNGKIIGTIPSFIDLRVNENDTVDSSYTAATRSYILNSKAQNILNNINRYAREVLSQQGITEFSQQEKKLREQLVASVDTQRDTTVVLVTFPKGEASQVIYSVTQADIERPRLSGSQPEQIADNVAKRAKEDLIQAWKEQQPPHLFSQAGKALLILAGLVGVSAAVRWWQKRLSAQKKQFNEALSQAESMPLPHPENFNSLTNTGGLASISQQFHHLSLRQSKMLNSLHRSALFWTQWLLWVIGIGYLCSLFYWSRPFSNWIFGVSIRGIWAGGVVPSWAPTDWLLSFGQQATLGTPLFVVMLILVTQLTIKSGDALSEYIARKWVERRTFQRLTIRTYTLSRMFRGWLRAIVYLLLGLAIVYHLQELGGINRSVAFFFGFFSFALSLASQDLLKDLIGGIIILWEDQYAVGDFVKVGDQGGIVEKISLRATQLRNLDGELITIPNGAIGIVRNLSSDWSQVNYAIEVSYEADVDRALNVMQDVAQKLYDDPDWQEKIVQEPKILGIDQIAHTGILIRVLIRTIPLEQWSVAREYRRRLKKAFDEAAIEVGIPKQRWA
jgi:small-conductance mechanosensitive channel